MFVFCSGPVVRRIYKLLITVSCYIVSHIRNIMSPFWGRIGKYKEQYVLAEALRRWWSGCGKCMSLEASPIFLRI